MTEPNPSPSNEPTPQESSNNEPPAPAPEANQSDNPPADAPPVDNNPTDTPPAEPAPAPEGEPASLDGADWREQYAGEDEKKLNALKRYPSQKEAFDALFAAKQKIRDGKPADTEMPEGEEDAAKWREERGIPKEAEGYATLLADGLNIADDDKEAFKGFFETMHAKNMPQETMNDIVGAYYNIQQQELAAQQEADNNDRQLTEDALRNEWGADYQANTNSIKNALSLMFPEEFHDQVMGARLANGTPLFSSVEGMKGFAGVMRKLSPHGTVVNSDGTTDVGSIESQLKSFESEKMGTKEYRESPKMQQNYRDLVDAYQRNTGKDWTGYREAS